eukprot:12071865-Ditylum_brightwellii.AAC.1
MAESIDSRNDATGREEMLDTQDRSIMVNQISTSCKACKVLENKEIRLPQQLSAITIFAPVRS